MRRSRVRFPAPARSRSPSGPIGEHPLPSEAMQRGRRPTPGVAVLAAALAVFAVAILVGPASRTTGRDSAPAFAQPIERAGLAPALSPAGSETLVRVPIPRHDGRASALSIAGAPVVAPETAFAFLHRVHLHRASTVALSVAPCRSPPLLSFS